MPGVESPTKHAESKPKTIRDHLWWIVISPCTWAIHFLACYITVAIWYEKLAETHDLKTLWTLISLYSVPAILVIVLVAGMSYQNFRRGDPPIPYDFDDPDERTHFLGFTAFLLSLLSLIATLYTVLVFVMVGGH
ncbi:transmembrane prediction [Stieleria varia]|nr:transmembrane prediction [Stieleria varia]